MHAARDGDRGRHAEARRNRPQPVPAIEVHVLAGVEDVEPAHPQTDGQTEQPRLGPRAAAGGDPPADRRHRHRQAEEELRVGGVALGERIPEHDRRARPAPARRTPSRAAPPRTRTPPRRPATKTAASRRLIAPRGISRMAVRGLSASKRASTARLKPMAALRALTMQSDDPAHLRPRERLGAPRQQRAGERERQREHRMAEADERQVGGQSGHVFAEHPRDVGRGDAGDQIFFHVPHVGRQAHADERGALPRLDRAVVGAEAQGPRADGRGALDQPPRGHGRCDAPRQGQLAEQIQIVDARQAVGAERDGHAGGVERRQRWNAGPDVGVAARTRDHRGARCRGRARCRRPCTARRGRSASTRPESRAAAGRPPASTPAAATRRSRRPASRAGRATGPSRRRAVALPRAIRPGAPSSRRRARWRRARMASKSAGETEYGACGARLKRMASLSGSRAAASMRARASATRASGIGQR